MTIDHRELLRSASRTFALSIERLPGVVGEAMCLAYLLLRVSDFLEDNDYMPPRAQGGAVTSSGTGCWPARQPAEAFVAELADRAPGDDPDARVAAHAVEILQKVHALPLAVQNQLLVHVRNSTQGMARWVARGPDIPLETDMDDYMHEVAGRVGYLVTDMFAWYSGFIRARLSQLMPLAREFGLALQTVNVIRGLRKDYERGWIFVPESFCAAVNLRRSDLFKPEYQIQALQVVDMVADKAEGHLQKALAYVLALPPWLHTLRLACIWPMLFAVRTLALSRQNVNVLVGEVKMTREEVKAIVRDTTLFGWSNLWLESYYRHLKVVPKRPKQPRPRPAPGQGLIETPHRGRLYFGQDGLLKFSAANYSKAQSTGLPCGSWPALAVERRSTRRPESGRVWEPPGSRRGSRPTRGAARQSSPLAETGNLRPAADGSVRVAPIAGRQENQFVRGIS